MEFSKEIEDKYSAEQEQAAAEHKNPTAVAMANHVISNHTVMSRKMRQAAWFVTDEGVPLRKIYLSSNLNATRELDDKYINMLGQAIIDDDGIPSSIESEYDEYAMAEEHGELKYTNNEDLIFSIVRDYDTDNLFVTRAIKLAVRDNKPHMESALTELLWFNNVQIRELQELIGHSEREGLDDEDDE